eukprot:COSAG06_NODE_6786_length_2783_cov_2.020492_2_plen_289_part_00
MVAYTFTMSEEERLAAERSVRLNQLHATPMEQWSATQVLDFVGTESSAVVQAFAEDEIDGEDFVALRPKFVLRMLRATEVEDPAAVAESLLEARDDLLAAQEGQPEAADLDEAEDSYEMINVLMMKEREANQKLMKNRTAALKARAEGFPIPVRRVGDIECETLKVQLHESVPVEGRLGRSALQDLVVSTWHPMKVVMVDGEAKEVVNTDDPMMQQMEVAYPGLGVAEFILARWQELQQFNPSGGYSVEIPWNAGLGKELTPAEVTTILMRGKGKRKKQGSGGGGGRR